MWVKSELVLDADIGESLHQIDDWYLVPKEYCYMYYDLTPFDSLVFHVCRKSVVCQRKANVPEDELFPYTCHRIWQIDMTLPCCNCHETPPQGLVTLWTLHNWNYLSEYDHHA